MGERIYHVWFSTKGRVPALDGEIGGDAKDLFAEIARRAGIRLMALGTGVDHVHLLIQATEDQTLSSLMHQLKGASSRAMFAKYPGLKMDLGQDAFWQKGYGFRRIDPSELPVMKVYVRTQASRPFRSEAGS